MYKIESLLVLLAICALSAFQTGCAYTSVKDEPLPGEPVADAPKMRIGDSWVRKGYTYSSGHSTWSNKIVEVSEDGSFVVELQHENKEKVINLRFDKNWTRDTEQAAKWITFPLFVGKKWSSRHRGSGEERNYTFLSNYYVSNYESIKTSAGQFYAFKVVQKVRNVTLGRGGWKHVYWYSPEAKNTVKQIFNNGLGWELISYSLANKENEPEKEASLSKESTVEISKLRVEEDNFAQVPTQDEKVKIGILEIQSLNQQARDEEFGKVFTEILTTSFVSSDAFQIIGEQLNKVLGEIKLTQSGIVDTSNVKLLGNMVGADAIVLGSITKLGDDLRLDIRIVDVDSGLILNAEKIEGKADIRSIGRMADSVVAHLISRLYK